MRSLLVPAGIVALGLLAALPFRRSPEPPVPPAVDPIGLPHTVTPLREAPLTGFDPAAASAPPLASGRFASSKLPAETAQPPLFSELTKSYRDVAVPLALPHDPGNLLGSSATPPAELARFGIPSVSDGSSLAASPLAESQSAESPLAAAPWGDAQWHAQREIPSLAPASALASVLDRSPNVTREPIATPAADTAPAPRAGEALASTDAALDNPGGSSSPAGRFQTVSQQRPGASDAGAIGEAEPRQRLFIREPR